MNIPLPSSNKVKKILIIRSARMDLLEDLFVIVRARFPNANIDVLVQESYKERVLKGEFIANIISVPDGSFKLKSINISLVKVLKKQAYDLYFLLVNNNCGRGYFSFRLLMFLTGIPNRIEFNIDRRFDRSGLKIFSLIFGRIIDLLKKIIGHILYAVISIIWKRNSGKVF